MKEIRLIKPYITYSDVEDDFKDIFESGFFTKGKNVQAFGQEFSAYTGAKYSFLTTSATTALWTCLKLLGVTYGDEVIVSDFSFPASSNVIEDLGAAAIFADVLLDTYNMCPKDLKKKISSRTKAVMFVDALGNPTGISEIKEICSQHNIPLIEDAACAIGSSEHTVRCGNIADLTCFSFHPRKLLCTGEGGAITTNNDHWAKLLQIKLNHGADGMAGTALNFPEYGYNFRLPELSAVMGRKQLSALDAVIAGRNETRQEYIKKLEPLGFVSQEVGNDVVYNVQSLVFKVPKNIDRDKLMAFLKKNGIETSIGTYALSSTTYNKNKYNNIQPNAKILFETTITLPCYHEVNVNYIAEKISTFILNISGDA